MNNFPEQESLEDKHKFYEEQVMAIFESKETRKECMNKIYNTID